MRRSRGAGLIVAGLVGVAGAAWAHHSQTPPSAPRPVAPAAEARQLDDPWSRPADPIPDRGRPALTKEAHEALNNNLRLPEPPIPPYQVRIDRDIQGAERARQEALAARLSRVEPVPDHRSRHFAWLNRPDFTFRHWDGVIEKVEPTKAGTLVTLRITPIVTSTHGASTTVICSSLETYLVSEHDIKLVAAVPPANTTEPSYLTD